VDPITHTLMGGSLAATGLRRTTALATPTLLIAANLPDVDVLALAGGPYTGLALRRGLTHGLPAMIVLPLLLTAAMAAWHRWGRRSPDPGGPPLRPGVLLGLACLGTWTHPILDWLNTYGMRWFLPFDGRWSYGDAVFIVDPWLWLLLGGPVFLTWSRSRAARAAWGGLAVLLSVPIVLVEMVPTWARVLWFAGLAAWIALRLRREGAFRSRLAGAGLLLAVGYMAAMVGQTLAAEATVVQEARDQGIGPIEDVMVGPAPVHPLRRQVIVQTESAYWTGTFHWARTPRVDWESPPRARRRSGPVEEAARRHPQARAFLIWARFPHVQVETLEEGWWVEFRDVRYDREGAGGLRGIVVHVDPNLNPVEAGPIPPSADTLRTDLVSMDGV
jgi:inner membrane protein